MSRPSKIWYRKDRKTYYVRIEGVLHNLGKDKKEAQDRFHALMLERPREPTKSNTVTAAEVMDSFLVWTKENRAPRTFDWYMEKLQSFLDSLAGQQIAASKIAPHHVESWVTGNGWSVSTKRGAMGAVKRAFKWAEKQGLIERSPVEHLERPAPERRDNCPTPEEYQALLSKTKDGFRDVLVFASETGARPQEVRHMQPRHYIDGKIQFPVKESKGKKHARVIYLNQTAREIIERRLKSEYIFTNRNGDQWTAYAINCRFVRLKKKVGKKFCLYDMRHYRATQWLESGLDHVTVAKLLGHQDATMLAKNYSHVGVNTDYLQQQVDKMR